MSYIRHTFLRAAISLAYLWHILFIFWEYFGPILGMLQCYKYHTSDINFFQHLVFLYQFLQLQQVYYIYISFKLGCKISIFSFQIQIILKIQSNIWQGFFYFSLYIIVFEQNSFFFFYELAEYRAKKALWLNQYW